MVLVIAFIVFHTFIKKQWGFFLKEALKELSNTYTLAVSPPLQSEKHAFVWCVVCDIPSS